jgi:hypothetical protein
VVGVTSFFCTVNYSFHKYKGTLVIGNFLVDTGQLKVESDS